MNPVKVLILEDNHLVAYDLAAKLEEEGFFITDIVDNGKDAITSVQKNPPDLALLDIKVNGNLDGIDTAKEIIKIHPLPIVYLTAYSDNATFFRAKKTSPAAYLTKPCSNERDLILNIKLAIERFRQRSNEIEFEHYNVTTKNEGDNYVLPDSIWVFHSGKYNKVLLENILWIEADGSYTTLVTLNNTYKLSVNLSQIARQIDQDTFMKIHRSYIVNLIHITAISHETITIAGKELPVNRAAYAELCQKFNIIKNKRNGRKNKKD